MNQSDNKSYYKCLIFLSIFYFTGWAATYPMVYKIVSVHHILETAAIFLFPLSYALGDVIAEVYGYKIARQVIWSSLACGFVFCVALEFIAKLPPATFWHSEEAYETVFGHLVRVYFALSVAGLCGSFINVYVISKWKILLKGRYFWMRSLCSTGIGEFAFTIIGSPLSYWGIQSFSKMFWLMLDGYLFKMLYAFIAVFPMVILVRILKVIEGIDVYDYGINYNPFKLEVN